CALRRTSAMSSSSTSVIQPTGLVHGHGECRYLDETIPVLSHILALELVDRRDGEATLKHPNTGWKLILHEGVPTLRISLNEIITECASRTIRKWTTLTNIFSPRKKNSVSKKS